MCCCDKMIPLILLLITLSECISDISQNIADQNTTDDTPRVRFPITLGGIGSIHAKSDGYSAAGVIPAIEMAVQDINSRDDLLADYEILFDMKDSKCDAGQAVKHLFDHLMTPPPKLAILGGGCSVSTAPVARTIPFYNIIQVGYSVGSPELSDVNKYPTFFRTSTPDNAPNGPQVSIIQHFNWRFVATLNEIDPLFSLVIDELHVFLSEANVSIITAEQFISTPSTQLDNILRKDARIIIFAGYAGSARSTFCEAYKRGLYGEYYQWLIPGWYSTKWMDVNDTDCSPSQIKLAANNTLGFVSLHRDTSGLVTDAKMTYATYERRYLTRLSFKTYGSNDYHTCGYDAVLALALALNQTTELLKGKVVPDDNGGFRQKRLDDFTYDDKEMSDIVLHTLAKIKFRGVSGIVSFNEQKDRRADTLINQYRDGEPFPVALYNDENHVLEFSTTEPIQWTGDGPPLDRVRLTINNAYVNNMLFFATAAFSACGFLTALAFLIFNIVFRNHSHIKMSSPRLNNVVICGCFLAYIAVVSHGLDGRYVTEHNFYILCTARAWLLAIAFTLAFGTMFAKTWRVHVIFTANVALKTGSLHDAFLLGMVGVLLLVDICVLSSWQIFNPLKADFRNGTAMESKTERVIYKSMFCNGQNMLYWMGALYAVKGFLLLFGCFLAFETRKVHVPELNDSQVIGVSIYNAVVMSMVGVAISHVLVNQQDISFAFTAVSIFVSATVTLCLLFVPKIRVVCKEDKSRPKGAIASATFAHTMTQVQKSTDHLVEES